VTDRIEALRIQNVTRPSDSRQISNTIGASSSSSSIKPNLSESTPDPVPGGYQNVSVLRANAMKFLPNFFERGQVKEISVFAFTFLSFLPPLHARSQNNFSDPAGGFFVNHL